MKDNRALASLLVVATLFGCAQLASAQGATSRFICVVKDFVDQPIKGVEVTVTTAGIDDLKIEKTTGRDGRCTISVADGTQVYDVALEKEGYEPLKVQVKPNLGVTSERFFKLAPKGQGQSRMELTEEEQARLQDMDLKVRRYNEGVEAQQAGDLETALTKYKGALEIDDNFAEAYTQIASVSLQLGNPQQALEAAEKATELNPDDFRAVYFLFDAHRKLGNEEQAEEAAETLRKAGDISDVSARIYNEAVDAYNAGNVDLAKATFQQALDLDPELVPAYKTLAGLYLKEGKAAQAAAMADEVLEREPDNVNALKIRYDSSRMLNDADKVAEVLAKLVVADPEWAASGLYKHGKQMYDDGDTDGAKAVMEQLLKVQPEHPGAHYILGLCLNISGDVAAAKEHLETFLELDPDNPEAPIAKEILKYIAK